MRVPVYAIEVRNEEYVKANKLFLQSASSVDEYVSFRTQRINQKAFQNAVALVAQIQKDSRLIVIENVSEDSFFVYDTELQQLTDIVGYYHVPRKFKVHIVVQFDDYITTNRHISSQIESWNKKLDPSDVRYVGPPTMITAEEDQGSIESEMDESIESLLSLDLTSFTVFTSKTATSMGASPDPTSEITLESYAAKFAMQEAKIEKQEAKIELLISTIQNLNEDFNRKMERIMDLFIGQTTKERMDIKVDKFEEVSSKEESETIDKDTTPNLQQNTIKQSTTQSTSKKPPTATNRRLR
jgi:hypothetical protein